LTNHGAVFVCDCFGCGLDIASAIPNREVMRIIILVRACDDDEAIIAARVLRVVLLACRHKEYY
jgi:hypothetical protein